jgi:uncharacterized protein YjdB
MKRIFTALILIGLVYVGAGYLSIDLTPSVQAAQSGDAIANAFKNNQSGIQVSGTGQVTKIFSDDTDGSRHQRFFLKLASNQTILIAHNIDLAPRVEALKVGDTISFYGVYEWNAKGGTVHWTHHDPAGKHICGWLKRGAKTYK